MVFPLAAAEVYRHCPEAGFEFTSTSELESVDMLGCHVRAREALSFGTAIRSEGFNLFVLGLPGHGSNEMVRRFLVERSHGEAAPEDWCYLYNFDNPTAPRFLRLSAGLGHQLRRDIERLVEELRSVIPAVFASDDYQNRSQELNEAMGELEARYADHPGVRAHLSAIRVAILQYGEAFVVEAPERSLEALFSRFTVNLLVDNADTDRAPVIYQDLPTHQHLVGRIEHHVQDGTLLTDFSLIRAGALHQANGGYLVLEAAAVLAQPGAWETLKRVLRAGEIRTESLDQVYGLMSTLSLKPEPIPLDIKIVLLGDRLLYYLLCENDPEFLALFKVQADLEDELDRDEKHQALYARMIATLAREAALRPLDPSGVAALIERASRLADDQFKLSARHRDLRDVLLEADHWASAEDAGIISRTQIEKAVAQQQWRAARLRELSHERITRGTLILTTQGHRVGQVNGLSVLQMGELVFGQPSRITATARPGSGQVVNIERESHLSGNIHAKGVMILSCYLANRYAPNAMLSLSASLAFEQSYGGVEGDSASIAELCVLVSAIARVGLDQSLAVTGSINQHGEVQAVGGVNEKIEGFFDVCVSMGPLHGQGVILPAANVANLMLKREVRDAMEAGRFRLFAVRHVDEALALLSGLTPGEANADGVFAAKSLNGRVQARLADFARVVKDAHAVSLDVDDGSVALGTDITPDADVDSERGDHGG